MKEQRQSNIKKLFSNFYIFPKLTIRSISFIGILIASSVVIFIVFASFVPFISIPSYKISFIGLPIKISGFIFGPFVGGFVGLISDLISFALFPTFYNIYYTLAAIIDGVIAGLVGFIFLKILKYMFGGQYQDANYENKIYKLTRKLEKLRLEDINSKKITKIENKIILINEKRKVNMVIGSHNKLLNVNLLSSILTVSLIILIISFLVFKVIDAEVIKNYGFGLPKLGLFFLMSSGYCAMIIFLIVARFKMQTKKYLVIVPIVIFSAIIELINVPLLSYADFTATTGSNGSGKIITFMFQHILFSPVKIWFNMFIIFYTFNVVSPLVSKNDGIMY
ncbi:ECF transporter S component [Mycoplasma tauri]|uniref:ECF transporter S component n=1 Tax=Mycoplasma tauri TaxID=547987 RepID=UPI001966E7A0|nr:ECF transporter S component [Mycoplasma tauri]MBZ4203346.1 ECF transporter S component [Mycoplasma tauri]MBZ4204203.1 ECF transporter S component [Mycoplasma tauri]MBZ4212736.1 ECF transporter S component [Mycoplasma tauri]MBZ4217996.1 ECF transporter S component [Mycoplasma tauri]MBZ4226564.1 ECF transporter S component [Mycoplasma tauri]